MNRIKVFSFLFVGIFYTQFISPVCGVSQESELTLTTSQKRALDRFRTRVADKLSENYMKQDIHLIRFLRAKYFDVALAEQFILEDVKWRNENSMQTIQNEDFSDVEDKGYKYSLESVDREGRPIIYGNLGDWDLRKAATTGLMRRLERYVDKNFELITRKVRDLQASGENVTQWNFLINMDNFNVPVHGCVICIPLYTYITNLYERHYPGYADKILLISTPPAFEVVLNLIRPLMSPSTRRAFKVYSQNPAEWKPEVYKSVDQSQLPPELGGTKIYSDTSFN